MQNLFLNIESPKVLNKKIRSQMTADNINIFKLIV